MMRSTRSLLAVALLLAASPFVLPASTAHAESLRMKVHQEQHFNLPSRGLSMAQVERTYGAPERKLQTRGGDTRLHPPIHRWEYPTYIVYFERSHVIHAVLRTPGPHSI
ncbi:MAG: hypothetical protein ACREP1_12875 [Rhodanobacteraceae bacterium]